MSNLFLIFNHHLTALQAEEPAMPGESSGLSCRGKKNKIRLLYNTNMYYIVINYEDVS